MLINNAKNTAFGKTLGYNPQIPAPWQETSERRNLQKTLAEYFFLRAKGGKLPGRVGELDNDQRSLVSENYFSLSLALCFHVAVMKSFRG